MGNSSSSTPMYYAAYSYKIPGGSEEWTVISDESYPHSIAEAKARSNMPGNRAFAFVLEDKGWWATERHRQWTTKRFK